MMRHRAKDNAFLTNIGTSISQGMIISFVLRKALREPQSKRQVLKHTAFNPRAAT
jgi:hypothetical protein